MTFQKIMRHLHSLSDPRAVAGMARFGVRTTNALGVSMPALRRLAKRIGSDHALALRLWKTGVHDARILAGLIDDPLRVTSRQMEDWVSGFDSWDVCDQVCGNLFDRTRHARQKARVWCRRRGEFVKRAGFVLMATLAVHDRRAPDAVFADFLKRTVRGAADERNFVKKAVNWAVRQIGKRNSSLNRQAVRTARIIQKTGSRAARWIAADALRELTGAGAKKILARRKKHA